PAQKLIGGQREEVERRRPEEDRIRSRHRRNTGAIPPQRQRRPFSQHASGGRRRDEQGASDGDEAPHRLDRPLDRLSVDQDRDAGQLAQALRLQNQERDVEDEKGYGAESREDQRLDPQRLPEDVAVPQRVEPQRVDVVRQDRSAAEHDQRQRRE